MVVDLYDESEEICYPVIKTRCSSQNNCFIYILAVQCGEQRKMYSLDFYIHGTYYSE